MNRRTDTLTPTIHPKNDYLRCTGTFSTRMNMLFKKKGMSEKSLYGNELTLYYTGKYQNVLDRAELVNSIFSFFTAFWRYIKQSVSRSVCLFVRPYVRRTVGFFFVRARSRQLLDQFCSKFPGTTIRAKMCILYFGRHSFNFY